MLECAGEDAELADAGAVVRGKAQQGKPRQKDRAKPQEATPRLKKRQRESGTACASMSDLSYPMLLSPFVHRLLCQSRHVLSMPAASAKQRCKVRAFGVKLKQTQQARTTFFELVHCMYPSIN